MVAVISSMNAIIPCIAAARALAPSPSKATTGDAKIATPRTIKNSNPPASTQPPPNRSARVVRCIATSLSPQPLGRAGNLVTTVMRSQSKLQTLVPEVVLGLRSEVVDVNVDIAGRRDMLHADLAVPVPIHLVHAQANVTVLTVLVVPITDRVQMEPFGATAGRC
jgi:hypothetical protein